MGRHLSGGLYARAAGVTSSSKLPVRVSGFGDNLRMSRALVALPLATLLLAAAPLARQREPIDVGATIARVGARVIEWYGRAQSIVSIEDMLIQPLKYDMSADAFPRRLGYELRVAWDPDESEPGTFPEPKVLRQILTVNGRPPKDGEEPQCLDAKPVSPEPLMMLLPQEREKFIFTFAGHGRVDDNPVLMFDYKRAVRSRKPDVTWTKECASLNVPDTRGRIWVDASTYDVLRLDEHLIGLVDFTVPREHQRNWGAASMVLERADSSIRYRRVEFQDPRETLMLPAQVDTVTVFRGAGIQRTRISQRFSGYRRFVADVRMLDE
jgi:hypothetical protein